VEDGEIEDAKKADSKEQHSALPATAAASTKPQPDSASTPSAQPLDQGAPAAAPGATPASSMSPTAAPAVQPAARSTPQTTAPRPETPTSALAAPHGVPPRPEINRTPSNQPRGKHYVGRSLTRRMRMMATTIASTGTTGPIMCLYVEQ